MKHVMNVNVMKHKIYSFAIVYVRVQRNCFITLVLKIITTVQNKKKFKCKMQNKNTIANCVITLFGKLSNGCTVYFFIHHK